jgi:hypothetical protein
MCCVCSDDEGGISYVAGYEGGTASVDKMQGQVFDSEYAYHAGEGDDAVA